MSERLWIFFSMLVFLISLQAKSDPAGTIVSASFANSAGARGYSVFLPKNPAAHPGLLVVLHGCFMTGQQMMDGTLLNQLAGEHGFAVLYPEQTYNDNSWKCWNWFKPENQARGTGESSIIVGMTQDVTRKYQLDPSRVFITGLSAGAAMASNVLGCYTDVFAGGLIGSGLEFAAAQTEADAHAVTATGPTRDLDASAAQAFHCSPQRSSPIKVLIVHGANDSVVNPVNGERTFALFSKLDADIFLAVGGLASEITLAQTKLAPLPGRFGGTLTETSFAGTPMVGKIVVDQMGHGWSGGQVTVPYMEPKGFDASAWLVKEFFL